MSKGAVERTENMAARMAAGRASIRRDGDRGRQLTSYMFSAEQACQLEAGTRMVIDSVGVSIILRPFYFDFARALDKLDRTDMSAPSRYEEVRALVKTWAGRGLDRALLERLACQLIRVDLSRSCTAEPAGVESKA